LGIGFCGEHCQQNKELGLYRFSSAYFCNGSVEYYDSFNPFYGPVYATGDIVGCGIDWETESYFFTLNGVKLGKFVWFTD
jgi:hypothetical protein